LDKKKRYKPRCDRWDIRNNLPTGAQIIIAQQCNCCKSYVNMVLAGKRKDSKEIIKAAELMAAINIWKTRFCKVTKSQL